MPPRKKAIGVFDSGFGGIDILRGITHELPEYDYVYLGDTARTPYGPRPSDTVYRFTKEAVDFLFSKECELVILACNTASSEALRRIQHEHLPLHHPGKNVLGVLIPAAEEAARLTKNHKVGIIATEGTVASRAFEREVQNVNRNITVFQQACPLLVPIVEAGECESDIARMALVTYLEPLLARGIDTLVLGCTHYGHLEPLIKEIAGPSIVLVSEARVVPGKLRAYLGRHKERAARIGTGASVTFYSTDLSDRFETLGGRFFGKDISVRRASL